MDIPRSYRSEPRIAVSSRELVNPPSDDFLSRASNTIKKSGITSIISNIFSSTPREYRQHNASNTDFHRTSCEQSLTNVQNTSFDNIPLSPFHNINTAPCRTFVEFFPHHLEPAEQPTTLMNHSRYDTEWVSTVHNRPLPPIPSSPDSQLSHS